MQMVECNDRSGKDGYSPDKISESKLSPTIVVPLRSKETYLKKRLSKDSKERQRKFRRVQRGGGGGREAAGGGARVDESSSYQQFQTQKTFFNME